MAISRAGYWLLAFVVAACAPDLRDGFYLCSSTGGCPDGFSCRMGHASATERRCYRGPDAGSGETDAGPSGSDATPLDAGEPDAGTPSPCDDGTRVVELVAGGSHTCTRRESGLVCCWGDNADGQLGNGTRESSAVPVVVDVPAGVRLERLDAGERATCAVDSDSPRAYCWGAIPDGSATTSAPSPVPLDLVDVVDVAVGGDHVCVRVGKLGAVRCMGRGDGGELGDGRGVHSARFVDVSAASLDVDVAERTSCAVETNGRVACWGLDPGSGAPTAFEPRTVERPGEIELRNIEHVSVAAGHRCGWGIAGVFCWGFGDVGQVDGTMNAGGLYALEMRAASGARDVAVGSGSDPLRGHSCAALETGVVCWGANTDGQLGSGDTEPVLSSTVVGLPGGATRVAAGSAHTCALMDDTSVWCWGADDAGQLGNGSGGSSATPVNVIGHAGR